MSEQKCHNTSNFARMLTAENLLRLRDRLLGKAREYETTEKPHKKRGTWTNKSEFYLSCLGYAIGIGNAWRFPYLTYSLGGGSFVIAYSIVLIVFGIPMVMIEFAIGQYSRRGPAVVFKKMCPLFGGLGYAILLNQFLICTYFAMIIAWTIFSLFASFNPKLPWGHCGDHSTPNCFSDQDARACFFNGGIYQARCYSPFDASRLGIHLLPLPFRTSSAEDYFNRYVLKLSTNVADTSRPDWKLTICLLATWTICGLCLMRGIKSTGKVIWFTTIFPLASIVIFVIQGAALPNALEGVKYYLIPDWQKLKSWSMWVQAAALAFLNLSVGGGGLITYSSYNKFKYNFYFDAISIPLVNGVISLLFGMIIFTALGFLSGQTGIPVQQVAQEGPGLAFIAYPDAITRMTSPNFWALLFFSMLLCLGLDDQFAIMETVISGITDTWPQTRSRKGWVAGGVCLIGFLVGLLFTTQAGLLWVGIFDYFVAGWPLIFFAFCEMLIVLIYGVQRFSGHISEMIGRNVNVIYKILWWTVIPIGMLVLIISDWAEHKPVDYARIIHPAWAQAIGWLLAIIPILLIPSYALVRIFTKKSGKTVLEQIQTLLKPDGFEPQWNGDINERTLPRQSILSPHRLVYPHEEEMSFKETHV